MTLLPRRLYLRVILLVSVILSITGVLSGWLTAKRQSDRLGAAMHVHALVMAGHFAGNCARFMVLRDYAGLEGFLLESTELPDLTALVVCEMDGRVVGHVRREGGGRPVTQSGTARITTPTEESPAIAVKDGQLVVWRQISAGRPLGWIRADYSMDSIRRAQTETWRQSLLVATCSVFCSAVMILIVLRPTALALGRLTAFARDLNGVPRRSCRGSARRRGSAR